MISIFLPHYFHLSHRRHDSASQSFHPITTWQWDVSRTNRWALSALHSGLSISMKGRLTLAKAMMMLKISIQPAFDDQTTNAFIISLIDFLSLSLLIINQDERQETILVALFVVSLIAWLASNADRFSNEQRKEGMQSIRLSVRRS